jgi:MarR family transcriptional regulator, 2-MHQ and catechol-resistance regulon repressor
LPRQHSHRLGARSTSDRCDPDTKRSRIIDSQDGSGNDKPFGAGATGKGGKGPGVKKTWSDEADSGLRLWVALARSYLTFVRVVSPRVDNYGLTIPQFGVLEALYHLGPLSLGELAEKLLVTGGNVTFVMNRLEEQDLVYRDRSDEDRRVILARLTPRGRDLIQGVFPEHAVHVGKLVSHLTLEEQGQLRELLKKLGKGMAEREERKPRL